MATVLVQCCPNELSQASITQARAFVRQLGKQKPFSPLVGNLVGSKPRAAGVHTGELSRGGRLNPNCRIEGLKLAIPELFNM